MTIITMSTDFAARFDFHSISFSSTSTLHNLSLRNLASQSPLSHTTIVSHDQLQATTVALNWTGYTANLRLNVVLWPPPFLMAAVDIKYC